MNYDLKHAVILAVAILFTLAAIAFVVVDLGWL